MKKLFFSFLFAWIAFGMNAQRVARETPPSFVYGQIAGSELQSARKLAIPFKVDSLQSEDDQMEKLGFPMRVAKIIPARFTPENAGEWTTLPDGKRIWRLEIDAPGANAVSLLYDKFIIPAGGTLFIYDVDYKTVNVYTSSDNPKRQEYSTDFIPGEKIRLEYLPASEADEIQLVISGISYAYKDVIASLEEKAQAAQGMQLRTPTELGRSGSCEVNANCSEGENWYHQKKGVAATLQVVDGAQYICSGTLLNNALQDRTPYFLMAYHCGGYATEQQFNQWRFYFFWERTGCDNNSPLAAYKMITGATLKVNLPLEAASDGLLLQLNESIPREWDVFFNGWDRRNIATAGGAGIHHPSGDVKKISIYTQTPLNYTASMNTGQVGANNAHWGVTYVATEHGHGVTEGGSSGSPLFNAAGRVIGTLTGGDANCANPSGTNIYGKMAWHWDRSPNPALRMAQYLDPNNSGIEYIDGTYGEADWVTFTVDRTSIYASEKITFTNHSYGDIDTYEWNFGANAEPATYTGQNPPAPVLFNKEGNYAVQLTAKKEGAIVGRFEVPIRVILKQNYCPATNPAAVGDSGSTTTAPFPLGIDITYSSYSLSASVYTAAELGIMADGIITDLEWEARTATYTNRTMTVYLKETDESEFASATTWASEIGGLTPVYQATLNGNPVGATKIHLATPFLYSGTKNIKVLVQVHVSYANLNSACVYTATASNTHQQWTNAWIEPLGAGTVNGNRPNIKMYYDNPCGANPPAAGFSLSATTINQGESVKITDLSTGPAVTYNWSFPGGTPPSGNAASPTVQYLNAGVYDITMEVINSLGKDSKTVTGAVTVNVHTPKPDFAAHSRGFTKQADFGPFLPATGGSVKFENKSSHYPSSFEWSFPGASPASSTEEQPEINYPSGTSGYSVSLSGVNTAGKADTTKTDYVQVGGTAEIWNVSFGENPVHLYTAASGWNITGASRYEKTAERFEVPAAGEISKIRIFTESVAQMPGDYMTVQLFSDKNGLPWTAISKELRIEGGQNRIANKGYNTFTFPEPAAVSGAFHVVVGSTNFLTTYFAVPCVQNRDSKRNTVSAYFQGAWADMGKMNNLYTSMNIIPEFTYTAATLNSPSIYKEKNKNNAAETIRFSTNGKTWKATADNWINPEAASGLVNDGNGSLTFTVDENTKQAIRQGVINLEVAGHYFKIYLTQAGAAPTGLTAAGEENPAGTRLHWTYEPHSKPGENIFDDAESYFSFVKEPQGYYPWTYIDGDRSATFGLGSGHTFPGMGEHMSFIAFDVSAFGTTAGLEAHSGTKYFACFSASSRINNDWMISPELDFKENFTFSFWAKSFSTDYAGGERFRAVYSTGGKTQDDFTNRLSEGPYIIPPLTWTKYTYTVPANAKYVAINCVTDDELIFMVDDIFIGIEAPDNALRVSAAAEESKEGITLQWHKNTLSYIHGNVAGGRMEVASRFTPEDLASYDRAKLKAVEIYTFQPCENLTVNIRQGDRIVYSQPVGNITRSNLQQRIALTSPVVIDNTQDLYIGYEYIQYADIDTPKVYVPMADLGPVVAGKGNLFSLNGGPFQAGPPGNWLISGYLEPATTDITFNVYRDGKLIAGGLTEKTYPDTENLQSGQYIYSVTAVYGDSELESTESNPVVFQKTGIHKINSGKLLNVYPNPARAGAKFKVAVDLNEAELKDAHIEVFNLLGVLVRKQKVTERAMEMSLPMGVYIIRLKGEESMIIVK